MQINADIDESDIGRIRPSQLATFHVDAYPADTFIGSVSQVRLQPLTTQNVVTYDVIINVANADLKLKPGMTANLRIATSVRDDAIRVPNAALRFRPTAEMFAALKQEPPAGAFKRTPNVLLMPDGEEEGGDVVAAPIRPDPNAKTIDALFGPLPKVESDGQVWVKDQNGLMVVPVRVGISDGQLTELIAGNLQPDTDIVTAIAVGDTRPAATLPTGGLFMPPSRGTGAFGTRRAG
jgi:HlyD family secretion protein